MPKRKPEVTLRTAGGILYKATRRKVKNLNIRVHPDGTVAVSIPFRSSWEEADRFVLRHRDWVQEAQRDLADREARTYWRPLPEKDVALAHFAAMSDKVYPAFAGVLGGQKPILKVRSMTSRWGAPAYPSLKRPDFLPREYMPILLDQLRASPLYSKPAPTRLEHGIRCLSN